MKKIFFVLLICVPLGCFGQEKLTQASNPFIGNWRSNGSIFGFDIEATKSSLLLPFNQVAVYCKNVFKHDTLYLYTVSSDCGSGYYPGHPLPKPKTVFAKCYIRNNVLCIIYVQKYFRDNRKRMDLDTRLEREPL